MGNTVQTPVTLVGRSPKLPASEPRTWTFINADTGQPVTVTCMRGCTTDHTPNVATPTYPDDVSCYTDGPEISLPLIGTLCESGRTEDISALAFRMTVNPFSTTIAERLPHLNIEVVEGNWLEGLDPDALETVAGQLQQQVDRLRVAHAQLVAVRDEYRRRAA